MLQGSCMHSDVTRGRGLGRHKGQGWNPIQTDVTSVQLTLAHWTPDKALMVGVIVSTVPRGLAALLLVLPSELVYPPHTEALPPAVKCLLPPVEVF